jgi:hypothetical protein
MGVVCDDHKRGPASVPEEQLTRSRDRSRRPDHAMNAAVAVGQLNVTDHALS